MYCISNYSLIHPSIQILQKIQFGFLKKVLCIFPQKKWLDCQFFCKKLKTFLVPKQLKVVKGHFLLAINFCRPNIIRLSFHQIFKVNIKTRNILCSRFIDDSKYFCVAVFFENKSGKSSENACFVEFFSYRAQFLQKIIFGENLFPLIAKKFIII